MRRRHGLCGLWLVLLSCVACASPKQPNIILILADDLGYAGLGSFGGTDIATPQLDALAANGISLTNFYANSTVCSPTRVALLSGRYQQRVGLDHIYYHCRADMGFDPAENPSLSRILKQHGYRTGIFGKWHLGSHERFQPRAHDFDQFVGFLDGNIDFVSKHNTESQVDWWVDHRKADQPGYVTDLLTEAVVEFIESTDDRPFFVYLSEAAVHVPMQAPGDPALRTNDFYKYRVDGKFPRDEYMRRYAGMLASMDAGIGRIMQSLRDRGIEENTLIIFTSDNGGESIGVRHGKANGALRGAKGSLYEGGIKVPAIVYWKGKLGIGSIDDQLMMSMDLMPTILDFAGIDAEAGTGTDGVSLVDVLMTRTTLDDRDVFWMHRHRLAMRRGDFKLIRNTTTPELYNLSVDPFEEENLAGQEQYADLLRDMLDASDAWQDATATGVPGEREIGVATRMPALCKRDLDAFNKGRDYYWKGRRGVVE